MTALFSENMLVTEFRAGRSWQKIPLRERLYGPTQATDEGCIIRLVSTNPKGYTSISHKGKQHRAHRFAWELDNGPIPDGMTIDHLCRQPACVNLDHLEIVTREENSRRRHGWKDGQCGKGHDLTADGAVVDLGAHRRRCRACWNQYMNNFRAERRAA